MVVGDKKKKPKKYPTKPKKTAKPGAKKRAKPDRPSKNVGKEH